MVEMLEENEMTIAGTLQNGVVVFDEPPQFPDGTRVEVVIPAVASSPEENQEPTLRSLLEVAGTVKGLPADFAEQHDHYIHGTPKR
ncbi:MAG: hypothetical protein WD872_11260 [Pirellulaceae bacterium]